MYQLRGHLRRETQRRCPDTSIDPSLRNTGKLEPGQAATCRPKLMRMRLIGDHRIVPVLARPLLENQTDRVLQNKGAHQSGRG